jgi:hypothetical protein
MDPILEEICRARGPEDIRAVSLRRWQDYLRAQVQPQLDQLAALTTTRPKRTKTDEAVHVG